MQILYFGSGAFGLPTLQALAQEHAVVGVVTQPDRAAGRGGKLAPTPIAQWASEHLPGVPIFKPENVNEPEVVARLRGLAPRDASAWVVIAFGQKLGRALLDGVNAMNLHASLLPRWRGAAPINHAILAGDRVTGNSVITLADRMDAGLILGQNTRVIEPTLTAGDLHDLLSDDGPALVLDVLARQSRGELAPIEQDGSKVTIAPKLSKSDGWVDFTRPAHECCRRIMGLNPWPGVSVMFQGSALKILRASAMVMQGVGVPPGVVFSPRHGLVTCGPAPAGGSGGPTSENAVGKSSKPAQDYTAMRLDEVQPPGKRAMGWSEFARGRTIQPGEAMVGGRVPDPAS